jgi:inositol phosphorylceramide mannosyltransferase catalytic subunit
MLPIPQIIHQTWKTASLPVPMREYPPKFRKLHPTWDYILWTDRMNRQFIKEYFPNFLKKYDKFKFNIQRVDAVRYLILYQFGGLYADLDFECLRNIEPLLSGVSCFFAREPSEHGRVHNKEMIICNAFMACTPKHTFMEAIYEELQSDEVTRQFRHLLTFPRSRWNINKYILETTGPFMLTRVYGRFSGRNAVSIIDDELVYPLSLRETDQVRAGKGMTEEMTRKLTQAYGVHHCWGSWWKNKWLGF